MPSACVSECVRAQVEFAVSLARALYLFCLPSQFSVPHPTSWLVSATPFSFLSAFFSAVLCSLALAVFVSLAISSLLFSLSQHYRQCSRAFTSSFARARWGCY